ncbi:glutaredoxin family protein [Paenibacillus sp. GCM10027627]|uniref:glutaredoxin family protein n=1 Tax=unclassified Paenibacillus TaxID=185978 RepID=UPI00362D4EB6
MTDKAAITIYTIPTCSDCAHAKQYFQERGISFEEKKCEESEEYRREVWDLTGKQTVPTLVVKGEVFVGFAPNLSAIAALLD